MRHFLTRMVAILAAILIATPPALAAPHSTSTTYGPASATRPGIVTTGTQSFAGNKTFLGTTSITDYTVSGTSTFSGTATFNKTAGSSDYESIAKFRTSDDNTGQFTIGNATNVNSQFHPQLYAVGISSGTACLTFATETLAGSDSGTEPIYKFVAQRTNGTAITTRPIMDWLISSTRVMRLTAAGGLSITGGTTPSITVGASGTAITQVRVYSQSLDVASVAANSTAEQTFTVTGLTTADKVFVNKPSHTSGLVIANVRVSAADTLAITFANITGSAIDPAAETYAITAIRS